MRQQSRSKARVKVFEKIDEQIQLVSNKDYSASKQKWITNDEGYQRKVEVAKCVKRLWTTNIDGKINLAMGCL